MAPAHADRPVVGFPEPPEDLVPRPAGSGPSGPVSEADIQGGEA
jgi:hypothetical protein